MRLPNLNFGRKKDTQIVKFLGVNFTQNTKEGELEDCYGLTTTEYPALTQHRTWSVTEEDADDIFEWDDRLAVIKGGVLYFDGQEITNVIPGKKQFAVVNTKLIIFPDKIYVDTTNGEYGHLDESLATSGEAGSCTITSDTISASIGSQADTGLVASKTVSTGTNPWMYVYGNNEAAVKACWVNGAWDAAALNAIRTKQGAFKEYIGTVSGGYDYMTAGYIFIPSFVNNAFSPLWGTYDGTEHAPDTSKYNRNGYYAILRQKKIPKYKSNRPVNIREGYSVDTPVVHAIPAGTEVAVYGTHKVGGYDWIHCVYQQYEGYASGPYFDKSGDVGYNTAYWTYDVYSVDGGENPLFSSVFSVGNGIDVTGTLFGIDDVEHASITAIDDSTNTMTFTANTFYAPSHYYEVTSALSAGAYALKCGNDYYNFTTDKELESCVFFNGDDKVYAWDGKVIAEYAASVSSSATETTLNGSAYDTSSMTITIKRNVPDFDYICSSGNRLWGVSNTTKTIHASELGKPEEFWANADAANGAWSLGVASDNDFTAIYPFVNTVYVWKEDRVIKVIGSDPSEYYTTEYEVAGVQKGSERSLKSVNNVLYYKGVYGVYSFGGYTPQPIAYKLGNEIFTEAVGGTDYKNYYLAMKRADGTPILLGYNIQLGLWIIMDKVKVDAMTTVGNTIQILTDGKILTQDGNGSENKWMAQFVPFIDDTISKKGFTKILLYVDMAQGSTFDVEISEDDSPFRKVYTAYATYRLTQWIPIRIGRCVRYSVRISGEGKTMLRAMKRESSIGSDV